ncbi:uncharacterized protein LOC119401372 [Rhipicephalus sanguineus]|uniref:uncharacterized protein LOC119401372 n=1 Tax=Rhipicephalus sanguineus TaxID=34632 RepID=UPI001893926B|nr:uncharacterized protein LOC119401372 [Rhipicephalus sanguineus]
MDSTLQRYQDLSMCLLNKTEWTLVYRNFYEDLYFGGVKCIKFHYLELNVDNTVKTISDTGGSVPSQVVGLGSSSNYTAENLIFIKAGKLNATVQVHVIYRDCQKCVVLRHPYANRGYGCTYWRSSDSLRQQAEGCEFIYDELCGTVPKYRIYDPTCTPENFVVLSWERVEPPPTPQPPWTRPSIWPPLLLFPFVPPGLPLPHIPTAPTVPPVPPVTPTLPMPPTLTPLGKDLNNLWNPWKI